MKRSDLPDAVENALRGLGGTANVVEVAKSIWQIHQVDLESSGDLAFTWQYDIRWAAQRLRDAGRLHYVRNNGRSAWQLIK